MWHGTGTASNGGDRLYIGTGGTDGSETQIV